MSTKVQHIFIKCDICINSLRKGLLWMGGGDYLECPQCNGTGKVEIVQQEVTPRGKIFIPGYTKGATIVSVEQSRRF